MDVIDLLDQAHVDIFVSVLLIPLLDDLVHLPLRHVHDGGELRLVEGRGHRLPLLPPSLVRGQKEYGFPKHRLVDHLHLRLLVEVGVLLDVDVLQHLAVLDNELAGGADSHPDQGGKRFTWGWLKLGVE